MKTKYIASILTLLLLASVFTFGLTINKASADPTTISIPSVSKTPSDLGNTFTVPVQISNVADLFGFDIKITWDNTLITFLSIDNSSLSTVWPQGDFQPLPLPGYQAGAGYVRYAAVATGGSGYTNTGTTTLFTITFTIVKAGNFPYTTSLHFDTVKLSDHNANTITATPTDGPYSMSAATPDLEFEIIDPNPSKPFEYCKTFEIKVYVTDVYSVEDYNLVIAYDSSLLKLTGVDWTSGVLGGASDGASYTESPTGTINVVDTGGIVWTGTKGLLFTLTFHVEFTDVDPTHIWRTNNLGPLHAFIKFNDATLSFVDGPITKSGINMPADLDIVVNLIQGDVDCNGKVDVFDLRTVAYYYDQSGPAKYDLKADGIIDIFDLVKIATNFGYPLP